MNYEAEKHAADIRIRAERKCGEFLASEQKANGGERGGRRKIDGNRTAPSNSTPTLEEKGITKRQSSDWQKLAKIPEKKFEKALAESPLPTTQGVINAAPKPPRWIVDILQAHAGLLRRGLWFLALADVAGVLGVGRALALHLAVGGRFRRFASYLIIVIRCARGRGRSHLGDERLADRTLARNLIIRPLLDDPEWSQWSDREIARRCAVNHEMVGKMRPPPPESVASGGNRQMDKSSTAKRKAKRKGTTYTQDTRTSARISAFIELRVPSAKIIIDRCAM